MTRMLKKSTNSVAGLSVDKAPPASNVLTISAPLLWYLRVARCFGHVPLTFVRHNSRWNVARNRGVLIYSWLITITLVIWRIVAFSLQVYEDWDKAMKEHLVMAMMCACIILILLVALATIQDRTKCLLHFFETMSKVEEVYVKRRFMKYDRRIFAMIIVALGITIVVVVQSFYILFLATGNLEWWKLLPYILTTMVGFTLESCFVFMACMLDSRAAALLAMLNDGNETGMADCSLERLHDVYEQQMLLRQCARRLDSGFGPPFLFLLLQLMIEFINNIFLFVRDLDKGRFILIFIDFEWIVTRVWWVLILVEPAHRYSSKDQMITEHLGACIVQLRERSALRNDWTESAKVEILWKQYQAFGGDGIYISALDICVFRRELLAGFAGTVATYLVILLQLQTT